MSDHRKHYGPTVCGGYNLEGYDNGQAGIRSWHVKFGEESFLVAGDEVRDAIATTFENGMVSVRPRFTRTMAPSPLKAALLKAVRRWEGEQST